MKNGWKEVQLGDVVILNYGKALISTNRVIGAIPVYSSAGITGYHNTPLVNSEGIIVGRKGSVGTVYYSPNPFFCIDTAYYILPSEDYNLKYMYYRISSLGLERLNEDSAVPGLNRDTAYSQVFSLPPLNEQYAIAAVFSCLDDKIANNKRINHHLELTAQAMFKSWFVDFEPWGGERPADWLEVELGDVATLNAGGDKPALCSSIPTNKCSIPIFSNGIDNFGLYGYTDIPRVTEECVTVSARGTIGFVCLRQEPFVPIVRLVTVIPNRKLITAKFLYLYLSSIHIAGVGTTQQQLTVPDFRKYRILVPNYNIVKDFTEIMDSIFDTIRHKRVESAHLVETRDTLLPRLMSGELSVTDLGGVK
jgi:type I restriction enzyme S subunit